MKLPKEELDSICLELMWVIQGLDFFVSGLFWRQEHMRSICHYERPREKCLQVILPLGLIVANLLSLFIVIES